jgi:hypothetical protein
MANGFEDSVRADAGITGFVSAPALDNHFSVNAQSPLSPAQRKERFHTLVAKLLYLSKRPSPDLLSALGYFAVRVTCANEDD